MYEDLLEGTFLVDLVVAPLIMDPNFWADVSVFFPLEPQMPVGDSLKDGMRFIF